jgi:putative membrane protein
MNRWWGRWVLMGVVTVGGSALAQEGMQQGARPQQRAAQLPDDPMTLEQLHHINQTEVTLGEMTEQKATSSAVREYGERLVEDHRAADQRMMELAKQKGYRLGRAEPGNDLQRRLNAAQMATKSKLSALQGRLYEQQFLASQVAGHDHSIALVMAGRQRYPELAPMLDALLPTLKQHRDRAYQLLGQVEPQQRQARPPPGERR